MKRTSTENMYKSTSTRKGTRIAYVFYTEREVAPSVRWLHLLIKLTKWIFNEFRTMFCVFREKIIVRVGMRERLEWVDL